MMMHLDKGEALIAALDREGIEAAIREALEHKRAIHEYGMRVDTVLDFLQAALRAKIGIGASTRRYMDLYYAVNPLTENVEDEDEKRP